MINQHYDTEHNRGSPQIAPYGIHDKMAYDMKTR